LPVPARRSRSRAEAGAETQETGSRKQLVSVLCGLWCVAWPVQTAHCSLRCAMCGMWCHCWLPLAASGALPSASELPNSLRLSPVLVLDLVLGALLVLWLRSPFKAGAETSFNLEIVRLCNHTLLSQKKAVCGGGHQPVGERCWWGVGPGGSRFPGPSPAARRQQTTKH
jgi:hypothetical protein